MIAIDESKWLFLQILYLHGISSDTRNHDFDITKRSNEERENYRSHTQLAASPKIRKHRPHLTPLRIHTT